MNKKFNILYKAILVIAYLLIPYHSYAVVNGTGASGQIPFWTDSTSISGSPSYIWNDAKKQLILGSQFPEKHNIKPTINYSVDTQVLRLKSGSLLNSNFDQTSSPMLWAQKFTKTDRVGDPYGQQIGGGLFEVYFKGSGVAGNKNQGTWLGLVANAVQAGENKGTALAQDWDAEGSIIGLAAYARANGYPGNGQIVTALWGYPSSPMLDDATFANLPAGGSFSTVGLEVNIDIRHKDTGFKSIVVGPGSSIGNYLFNYRKPSSGVKDWSFGIALNGNPNDNNYQSPDINNWNGFHTGILVDKIKDRGILFGRYFKDNSYGIAFPDTYAGAQRPKAALYLGNTQINMGQFKGGITNNGDLWRDGAGNLQYKKAGVTQQVVTAPPTAISFNSNKTINIGTDSDKYKLVVGGDVSAKSFVNVSTRNEKKDISYLADTEVDSLLSNLKSLQIAKYRYNQEAASDSLHIGLIAEEAPQAILSENGKGIDLYELSTMLLGGIQAQQKQISDLEKRIEQLEKSR